MIDNSFPQPGKTYSLCLKLDAFMKENKYPADYENLFIDSAGHTLTPQAALTFLAVEKAKGRKVIPMSDQCGRPCKHAGNGCTGFDYSGGGCPGRLVKPDTATIR